MSIKTRIEKRKVEKSLKTLKKICNSHTDCGFCPLRGVYGCIKGPLEDCPGEWDIEAMINNFGGECK